MFTLLALVCLLVRSLVLSFVRLVGWSASDGRVIFSNFGRGHETIGRANVKLLTINSLAVVLLGWTTWIHLEYYYECLIQVQIIFTFFYAVGIKRAMQGLVHIWKMPATRRLYNVHILEAERKCYELKEGSDSQSRELRAWMKER